MVPTEELFADHYNGHRHISPTASDHPTTTSRPSRLLSTPVQRRKYSAA